MTQIEKAVTDYIKAKRNQDECVGFIDGYTQCQKDMADKKYTEQDMLNAAKYGYEFRDTTSFPQHKFEDSCINNTKQWLQWYNEENNK